MGGSHILHAAEIIGAFLVAHHFWPKGITYGDKEDWEIRKHERNHGHSSKKHASKRNNRRYEDSRGSRHYHDYEPSRHERHDSRRSSRYDSHYERPGERRSRDYY
ncbi:hypothetical protein BP5796_00469 [Coleophoma crateriformis]|uniref:Uncharacterized protein n=1 Tax=Coleophoma crateriformis TaxID=565419 RepID=A0A3D8T834_9HELO|nr:hypothetical protein BP5796_00469 [Coleophoma crateriformis]